MVNGSHPPGLPKNTRREFCVEWNEERISALKQLWSEGMSASQVARQLGGVSRNAVIGKVHRMGLAVRAAPSKPRAVNARTAPAAPRPRATPGGERRVVRTRPITPVPTSPRTQELTATASILTLKAHACRWPIGEPDHQDFGFCGRARSGHVSYCDAHLDVAMRPKGRRTAEVETQRLIKMFGEVGHTPMREFIPAR